MGHAKLALAHYNYVYLIYLIYIYPLHTNTMSASLARSTSNTDVSATIHHTHCIHYTKPWVSSFFFFAKTLYKEKGIERELGISCLLLCLLSSLVFVQYMHTLIKRQNPIFGISIYVSFKTLEGERVGGVIPHSRILVHLSTYHCHYLFLVCL